MQTSIVTTVHVILDSVSKSKQKDQNLIKEYYQLHPKHYLDWKLLTLILTHQDSLRCLLKKTRHSKLKRRRRRTKKNRKIAASTSN